MSRIVYALYCLLYDLKDLLQTDHLFLLNGFGVNSMYALSQLLDSAASLASDNKV